MQEISNKIHFPELEKEILQFWRDEQIFQKSIDQRPEDRPFIFYDGPPFATGLPHYGHLLAGTIKDVIPRYKTMRNFRVERCRRNPRIRSRKIQRSLPLDRPPLHRGMGRNRGPNGPLGGF